MTRGLLFRLARLNPEPGAVDELQGLLCGTAPEMVEGKALVQLALETGVAPIIYQNLTKSDGFPPGLLRMLFNAYLDTLRWNRKCLKEILRIVDALRSGGVAVVPLKGAVAAQSLLGDLGLYAGSDIDILVPRACVEEGVRVLREQGYSDTHVVLDDSLIVSYHHSLKKQNFVVELHWNLLKPPFQAAPEFWWEDAVPGAMPAGTAWALSSEKYLLYLIYRLYSHGFTPLRFFVLPMEIANGRAGPVDWPRFIDLARRCRMERLARFALAFMKDQLGAEVPEDVVAPSRGRRRLHDRIARALVGEAPVRQLTRLRLYQLFDSRIQIIHMGFRKLFPPLAEIRWRYYLTDDGWRLLVLYVLNPVLLLVNVAARDRFIDWFCVSRRPQ